MPAVKGKQRPDMEGNQFWKLRSRHGRKRLFETPKLLWEAASEYFEWCDEHPYLKPEQKKGNVIVPKGAELSEKEFKETVKPIVDIPIARPYTIDGLCSYLDVSETYIWDFEESLIGKNDQTSKDFSSIITRIRKTIRDQQIGGGLIGAYNPMLVARIQGLKEKTDITTNDKDLSMNIKISRDEAKQLAEDLDKEV